MAVEITPNTERPVGPRTYVAGTTPFSASNLPIRSDAPPGASPDPNDWPEWNRKALLRAVKIDGPFEVERADGTVVPCDDGFVALDVEGNPFPVATAEMAAGYERW